jgi:hypothetical protein
MKSLFVFCLFTLVTLHASMASACSINVKVKKDSAASGTVDGISFTKKQLTALATVCKINRSVYSTNELVALETAAFNKKLAKLKSKN